MLIFADGKLVVLQAPTSSVRNQCRKLVVLGSDITGICNLSHKLWSCKHLAHQKYLYSSC